MLMSFLQQKGRTGPAWKWGGKRGRVEKWPKQCMHMWRNEQQKKIYFREVIRKHFCLGKLIFLFYQVGPVLPLSPVLLKKRDKPHKEDKVFLLVELRIAIQKIPHIAFVYPCLMTHVDSSLTDLYTGSWSPSHDNLCCFRVSVLAPLQWGHQMLSCFGFSTYFYITQMCSPLVMWSKSNLIATLALDLMSTYEGEHTIFVLLSLADLAQNDVLLFHPFTCKW
jgi:hypothetical protein